VERDVGEKGWLIMDENRNISLSDALAAAIRVAIVDTARNFFRPIHNAKVLLGQEREQSVSERLREEEDRIIQKHAHPAVGHDR
jgi:hypothetical protein